MRKLTQQEAKDIQIGASIMSTGGGGDYPVRRRTPTGGTDMQPYNALLDFPVTLRICS